MAPEGILSDINASGYSDADASHRFSRLLEIEWEFTKLEEFRLTHPEECETVLEGGQP